MVGTLYKHTYTIPSALPRDMNSTSAELLRDVHDEWLLKLPSAKTDSDHIGYIIIPLL